MFSADVGGVTMRGGASVFGSQGAVEKQLGTFHLLFQSRYLLLETNDFTLLSFPLVVTELAALRQLLWFEVPKDSFAVE